MLHISNPDPTSPISATSAVATDARSLLGVIANLLREVRRELHGDRNAAERRLVLAEALLADGIRVPGVANRTLTACRGGLAPWQARRIEAYVSRNLSTAISLDDLSTIAELSTSYFSRAFKVSFGIPPHAYLIERRMTRAQELMLSTDWPLAQIALECGLSDQAHFSRMFRNAVGSTPAEWRRWRRVDLEQRGPCSDCESTASDALGLVPTVECKRRQRTAIVRARTDSTIASRLDRRTC